MSVALVFVGSIAIEQAVGSTETAIEKIKQGDDAGALTAADAALAADSSDGKAHFLRGMALNRLADFPEAVRAFAASAEAGYTHDHGLFEVGWAALGAGRSREAIVALQAYEAKEPGRAQTSEFLGRAYLQLGQYDRAETLLKQAIERDAAVTPTANVYLAVVAKLRGDQRQSMDYIRSAVDADPQSPVSQVMQGRLEEAALARVPQERRWRLTLSTAIGYNDNALVIDDNTPLPAGISDRDGVFFRNTLHGAYDVIRDADQTATLGYAFQADTFASDDFDDIDYINHYWYAEYFRKLNSSTVAGIRVSDDYAKYGNEPFRNRVAIRPTVGHRFNNFVAGEVAYSLLFDEYYFATIPVLDRDAIGHLFEGTFFFSPPKLPVRFELGAQHLINDADGNDHDYNSTTLFATVEAPLPFEIIGEVTYAYTFGDYAEPNSLSFFAAERQDDTELLRLQFTKPVAIHSSVRARVYIRYEYIENQSNLNAFDFDQNVISGGLVIDF